MHTPSAARTATSPPFRVAEHVLATYVAAIAAVGRSRAATDALEAALLADLVTLSGASGVSSDADLELRSLAAEVGAAIHVSDRTIQHRMSDAYQLTQGFPAVHAALSRGEITASHVRVILDAGAPITDDETRGRFAERALALARAESPNRLRGMLARVAEEVRPVSVTQRHQEARRERAVWITDDRDGMSTLHAHLPSVLAHGVKDRLDQMARALRRTPVAPKVTGEMLAHPPVCAPVPAAETCADPRTADQVRADLLADLLLTAVPRSTETAIGAIRATVAITIPALTLAGIEDSGTELDGSTPIDAQTARLLAGGAPGWDRVITDPVSGAVRATDRYRPTAEMRRFLTHRDQHCRHPGCRVPIRYTDIDHNRDWADGGKTNVDNLAPLCRRHHTLKTSAGWKIHPYPGGVVEFVTPLGYRYIDTPEPRSVSFTPVDAVTRSELREGDDTPTAPADRPPW